MRKLIGSFLLKVRERDFQRYYTQIKSISNNMELLRFQENCLKNLLLHAYQNVSYYHKIFEEFGIIEGEQINLSKFSKIPILTKEIIRKQADGLLSKDYMTRRWYYNTSGGSTGEPVKFVQDNVYDGWAAATSYYYYKHVLGIEEPIVKKVILWGSERDIFQGGLGWKTRVINWLSNTIFLNTFRMTEEDIEHYLNVINQYKPDLVRGYASSLYELCRFAERKGIKVYTPKIVVSTAEVLRYEMRETIEGVFGTKVYDFYGSREANNLAGECKEGLMHVLAFHNYMEILDRHDQPVNEGEEGRVIITNLHNYSMPFIRYEVGDMAVLGPKKCKCGSPLPTLRKVTGRITDHFIRTDGTLIHGEYFTHLFYFKDWVKAFRVIQEDYQKVRILVVLKNKVHENEKVDIESKIKLVMGEDCQIVWEFVEDIPKTSQGKYLYTKSVIGK